MKFEYPFQGTFRITQKFRENPANYKKFGLAGHDGIDFACPNDTDLLAPMAGKTYVGWAPTTWGLFYSITNDWGTVYLCHLKENFLPSEVDVASHQLIGKTDNTGNSTGPHLHIGLRVKGIKDPEMKDFVDPLPYLEIVEKPQEVVETGQAVAIDAYQQLVEDLNVVLKLPVGNKDFVKIQQKCAELMVTAGNYDNFLKRVAEGIGCAEVSEKAVLEALGGLEAHISVIKTQRLEDFGAWERVFSGLVALLPKKK